jgi:G3E family GTPase
MTRIDLITGILGSGKTTFLLRYGKWLLDQGERIAVIVNDFGAVNVDLLLLQQLACDRCEIVTICGCGDPNAHKRRYKTQLIALGMQQFDRVLIEPSGIFDMDEFFDTLYESPLDRWFTIGSVLTIVDAQMEDDLGDQMEFLLGSEAAFAGKLILSKLGCLPENERADCTGRVLLHIDRALEYIRCDRRFSEKDLFVRDWEALTDEDLRMLSNAGYRGASYVKLFNAQTIRSSVHYFMHLRFPEDRIAETVEAVIADPACGHVYRIKGSLPADDGGWRKLNATREQTELSPVPNGQAVLIVIGDHLDLEHINAHFQAVNTDPEYVSV